MTDFSYRLAVLTHGDAPTLDRTIESFAAMVTPRPVDLVCVVDGEGGRLPPIEPLGPWGGMVLNEQRGFCGATSVLWDSASKHGPDFVVWLENDFEFLKPVNLAELATVLRAEPQMAQMSLMRGAVNPLERRAGGLYALHRREYQPMTTHAANDWLGALSLYNLQWLEHHMYLTTNPSLMTTAFMRENPWPSGYDENCEGRFSHDLMARGYRFGVWGNGEQWIDHIGERTGFGY